MLKKICGVVVRGVVLLIIWHLLFLAWHTADGFLFAKYDRAAYFVLFVMCIASCSFFVVGLYRWGKGSSAWIWGPILYVLTIYLAAALGGPF